MMTRSRNVERVDRRISAAAGEPGHVPVLATEVLHHLGDAGSAEADRTRLAGSGGPTSRTDSETPRTIVDCTLGLGGHAALLLKADRGLRLVGLDLDPNNLKTAADRLAPFGDRVMLRRANFAEIAAVLAELRISLVHGLLADLGFSSNQLEDPARGLSFERDGPLDMRLDRDSGPTAADLVNSLPEGELADLLYVQADERASRRISRRICQARRQGRIQSTGQLAGLVAAALGRGPSALRGRIHPATRTFLALRMAVNREPENLRALLKAAPRCLAPGGRIAVISFQSREDRIVKEAFRSMAGEGVMRLLTRKPVRPGDDEVRANPRSRSAKLRVAEKVADR